jgi:protease-4
MTRRLAVWLLIVLVLVALVVSAAASAPPGTTSIAAPLERNGITYTGTVEQDGGSGVRIAMVPIYNVMVDGDSAPDGSATGADDIVRMLDAIRDDEDSWDGVMLELDTPGGAVLAAEEVARAIERLKSETDLPVLAWMRGTAASAGYYVAAPTDRIVASANTFTGSIGVILEYYVVAELADEIGVQAVTIKSGELKDIANPFRETTPRERELLQTIIDQAYDQFVGVVAEGRDMSVEEVRPLADGRIYTGLQAKEVGLVDVLGLRERAYEEMAELVDEKDVDGEDLEVVSFDRQYGVLATLFADAGPAVDSLAAAGDTARALRGDPAAVRRLAGGSDRATPQIARLEYRAVIG